MTWLGMTVPKIHFEGLRINFNSMLLLLQLIGVGTFGVAMWRGNITTNTDAILELKKDQIEMRVEMARLRDQSAQILVLRNMIDNVATSATRIENNLNRLQDKIDVRVPAAPR